MLERYRFKSQYDAGFIVIFFTIFSLIKLYPYNNEFQTILIDSGNDWSTYAKYGLDIKNNGLLLPVVDGPYERPASFMYNYFLALCFKVFGENTTYIYLLQSTMLGFSISFIYLAFRESISIKLWGFFLFALLFFGLKDVSEYCTQRLLGENLALFSMSLFSLLFSRGILHHNHLSLLLSSVCLSIAALTRPNIFPFIIFLVLFIMFKKPKNWVSFILTLGLFCSLLAFRNYLCCGQTNFLPTHGAVENTKIFFQIPESIHISKADTFISSYLKYMLYEPVSFFSHFFKKTLFCMGFLPMLDDTMPYKPHWMVIWFGYFIYLFKVASNKLKINDVEKMIHVFIFTYFGTLILIAPVENYGFRMLIPGLFFVIVFFFKGLSLLISERFNFSEILK
ncbi:MAG: glycosyltransferase family 39 protein [Bacteroidota bacterium]|jgi:hypothetical protein